MFGQSLQTQSLTTRLQHQQLNIIIIHQTKTLPSDKYRQITSLLFHLNYRSLAHYLSKFGKLLYSQIVL